MAYENRPGDGAAFANKYASGNPKAPVWKGYVHHHQTGDRIELAIWEKTSRKGEKFLSIKASEPRSMSEEAFGEKPAPAAAVDSDLPF